MSLVVLLPDGVRKETVKVTPSTTLAQVLQQVCTKQKLDPDKHTLVHNGKELQLSLSFRLSGLTQGQKVSLQKKKDGATENVLIALQLPSGERVQQEFPSSTSLLEIVQFWENKQNVQLLHVDPSEKEIKQAKGQHGVMQPVIVFMNREISTVDQFKTTTLSKLGLSSGGGLLRLGHKLVTDQSTTEETVVKEAKSEEMDVETNPSDSTIKIPEETQSVKSEDTQEVPEAPVDQPQIPADRNVQVFSVASLSSSQEDLPDSFYEVTQEDLAYLMEMERKRLEEKSMLKTKDIREREKQGLKFSQSILRIRFPDRVQIQGTFYPTDKTEDIISFVKGHILEPNEPFYLSSKKPVSYLKPEVLQLMKAEVPVATPTTELSSSTESKEEVKDEPKGSSGVEDTLPSSRSTATNPVTSKPKWFQLGGKKK